MSRNSTISDETLMGYLLLALPDAEQWRIEALAASDTVLQQRIEDLRELLAPIRESEQPVEPCAGLTASTMAFIEKASHSDELLSLANPRMSQPLFESDRATRLAWIDSIVTVAAGIVILTILLPSIWYSRESARRLYCAENLRQIGHAITLFRQGDLERKIPKIELDGPLAFAGVYAVRLKQAGLLETSRLIWCPAMESLDLDQTIPTVQVFLAASPQQQENWKFTAGGNYSFNLGNVVEENYTTPGFAGRSHFAVLGDSLMPKGSDEDFQTIHGRNTSNVLYDDGRIQSMLVNRNFAPSLDNPYLNRALIQAVGYGLDDTCLGPSFQNPLRPVGIE